MLFSNRIRDLRSPCGGTPKPERFGLWNCLVEYEMYG